MTIWTRYSEITIQKFVKGRSFSFLAFLLELAQSPKSPIKVIQEQPSDKVALVTILMIDYAYKPELEGSKAMVSAVVVVSGVKFALMHFDWEQSYAPHELQTGISCESGAMYISRTLPDIFYVQSTSPS